MKTFRSLSLILAGIFLLWSCSKPDEIIPEESSGDNELLQSMEKCAHGPNTDRFVIMKSTGLKVHYKVIGKGPLTIVFIPGWTNPLEIFRKQFNYFKNKARCIYIDVPGQGLSDAPEGYNFTMDLMADAIYDVIKKEGVHRFVAVGFSMGPVPLGVFERNHPGMITKLINLDGDFVPWPDDPAAKETYRQELEGFCSAISTWGETEKREFAQLLINENSPEDLKLFVEYFYQFPSERMANIYWNVMQEEVNRPVGWTYPILCIFSTEHSDLDYLDLYFPNAEIETILNFGHVVQWENPDYINSRMWDFIIKRNRFPYKL